MLDILYHDSHLVAINKPSGLLVHRSKLATDRVTCMTMLRDELGCWVYPIHRLDRGASGVLLFALDSETTRVLGEELRAHSMEKRYLALVRGWAPELGEIDHALVEEDRDSEKAMPAVTRYRRLATVELQVAVGRYSSARYSLVEAEPLTGRRHQVRRHMAHIRHPIVGDTVHGEGRHNRLFREMFASNRLLLHGKSLAFGHPVSGSQITVEAPVPPEMEVVLEKLGCQP